MHAEGDPLGGRAGTPGGSRLYWVLWTLAQSFRLRYRVRIAGAGSLGRQPVILAGNHLTALDPVFLGISLRRRLVFFTKAEAYGGLSGVLMRLAGQLPLVRGDQEATDWALDQTPLVVARGADVCIYPEGTRSPDAASLHRLHPRVLVPLMRRNAGTPLHVVAISYAARPFPRRTIVDLRVSPAIPTDPSGESAAQTTTRVRDALLATGGMPYVHSYGTAIKERHEETP
jgi:1-acyl-sn-glycerol-3-phosphate acyltransferase